MSENKVIDATPTALLHHAIWNRDLPAVQRLLDAGADPDARDPNGWPALSRAIERRQPEIALLLIAWGADYRAPDRRQRTPLHWAAQYGTDAVAEKLLERGAEAVVYDNHGNSPLAQASRHGRTAILKMLLHRHGTAPKSWHWSGLFFSAIRNRHPDVVASFLDAGWSVDSATLPRIWKQQVYYPTALMEAIITKNPQIVDLLLQRGADISKKSQRHSTLTEAITYYGKDAAITRTLLNRGASIGLEEAIVTDDLALAEKLLSEGADPEMVDDQGQTLLTWAARHRRDHAARLLVRFGANPNTDGKYAGGALAGAAAAGSISLAEFLTEHGADANASTNTSNPRWYLTPLVAAARMGEVETMRWLIDRFGMVSEQGAEALTAAAARDRLEAVRFLLNAGVDADATTVTLFRRSALMYAAWNGSVEMSRLLLDRGANAGYADGRGRSVLSFAAGAGRKRVLPLLIARGVTQEQKGKALIEALQGEHSDTAEILLQCGADPNTNFLCYDRATALMLAAKRGKISTVRLLLEKGAMTDAADRSGKTALDYAEQAGRADVATLLRQQTPRRGKPPGET